MTSRVRETAACRKVFLLDEYRFSWEQLQNINVRYKISKRGLLGQKVGPQKSGAALSVKPS